MTKILAAVIVVLAGCSEAVGPHIDGIDVTLSLSHEEMAVGDTIEIRVLATNTTALSREYHRIYSTPPTLWSFAFSRSPAVGTADP